MVCNRAGLSEAIANIPYNEQPTRELLEGYRQRYTPEEDLAWDEELYSSLAAWVSDRETKKKRKDQEENGVGPQGIERFNYSNPNLQR